MTRSRNLLGTSKQLEERWNLCWKRLLARSLFDSLLGLPTLNMWVKFLVTNSTTYDMLFGMELLFPPIFYVDTWHKRATYYANWEERGSIIGQILLDLNEKMVSYSVSVLPTFKEVGYVLEAL